MATIDQLMRGGASDMRRMPTRSRDDMSLAGILSGSFDPELRRTQGQIPELERAFLERLRTPTDFSAFRGELSAMAESLTNELFRPGGAVEGASRQALGRTVDEGFGPSSGSYDRARTQIHRDATGQVARAISQGALQIAPIAAQSRQGDIAALLDYTGLQQGRADNLRESLFGGRATLENLGMAREQMDLNRRLIEESLRRSRSGGGFGSFLGRIGGGLVGSFLGPLGATAGAAAGDRIAGLFGGE